MMDKLVLNINLIQDLWIVELGYEKSKLFQTS